MHERKSEFHKHEHASNMHKHDHKSYASVSIKAEPPSPNRKHVRKIDDVHDFPKPHRIKSEPRSPGSPKRGRNQRLDAPVILTDELPKRRRISSPQILDDDYNDSRNCEKATSSNVNLGRSGLINNSGNASSTKQHANFELSGKLAEDTNTYKGVVIKYNEPHDAEKPVDRWRLYVFKGKKTLSILHIHRQSGFLIGRDRNIVDLPMDHPSISKQHAVLQYRRVRGVVRLYLIDLESANGTYLNNNRIDPKRYYELIEKDLIKFGFSSREYVVMTADTTTDDEDDNET